MKNRILATLILTLAAVEALAQTPTPTWTFSPTSTPTYIPTCAYDLHSYCITAQPDILGGTTGTVVWIDFYGMPGCPGGGTKVVEQVGVSIVLTGNLVGRVTQAELWQDVNGNGVKDVGDTLLKSLYRPNLSSGCVTFTGTPLTSGTYVRDMLVLFSFAPEASGTIKVNMHYLDGYIAEYSPNGYWLNGSYGCEGPVVNVVPSGSPTYTPTASPTPTVTLTPCNTEVIHLHYYPTFVTPDPQTATAGATILAHGMFLGETWSVYNSACYSHTISSIGYDLRGTGDWAGGVQELQLRNGANTVVGVATPNAGGTWVGFAGLSVPEGNYQVYIVFGPSVPGGTYYFEGMYVSAWQDVVGVPSTVAPGGSYPRSVTFIAGSSDTPTPSWTPTRTFTPTWTPTPTFTDTVSIPPSNTATSTATWTNTATRTPTPTFTPTSTDTPVDTATFTSTWTPTATVSPTPTFTDTPAAALPIVTMPLAVTNVLPYPNPADGDRTSLYYELSSSADRAMDLKAPRAWDPDAKVELQVYTLVQRLVWSANVKGAYWGGNEYAWDLKDDWGKRLSNGTYLVQVTVTSKGKTSTARQMLMVLR